MTDIIETHEELYSLTQDLLRELFTYRDGELYWKVAKGARAQVGDLAGNVRTDGYCRIGINGKDWYVHRLIFLYHHGYVPKFLDHIDGDPMNNKISNLRGATMQENNRNSKKRKSVNGKPTSSKYKGVGWSKRDEKWVAQIKIDGKNKYIGLYTSETEAAESYDRAAIELFGEFAKLNDHQHKIETNSLTATIKYQLSPEAFERATGNKCKDFVRNRAHNDVV